MMFKRFKPTIATCVCVPDNADADARLCWERVDVYDI